MKDLLVGMGIGFIVGAITCKCNKPVADTIEKGVEKSKEIINDVAEEIKTQASKTKGQQNNQ